MPIDPSIALGVRPVQIESPVNAMAQMYQLQGLQQQGEMNRFKIQEAERDYEQQAALQRMIEGGLTDRTKLLGYGKSGISAYKSLAEADKEQRLAEKVSADLAAQRIKNARSVLPAVGPQNWLSWRDQTIKELPELANVIPEQYSEDVKNRLMIEADKYLEQHFVSQGLGGTERVLAIPKYQPGTGASVVPGSTGIVTPSPNAPRTTVNVAMSTEKKFGEQFAGKVADKDVALLEAAEKAPEVASNANRILQLAKNGQVFTGSAANVKLQVAKALQLAGASNDERIRNTEVMMAAMAANTLGAIKASGLGAGQGFTNTDREFLEKAVSGQISFDTKSIRTLAELSHKAAEVTADRWNKRVKQIPTSALEGTGVPADPITVPKKAAASNNGPKIGTIEGGYRFKGGNPADPKSWEKQ